MEPLMIGCYLLFKNFHVTTYQNILGHQEEELNNNQEQSDSASRKSILSRVLFIGLGLGLGICKQYMT